MKLGGLGEIVAGEVAKRLGREVRTLVLGHLQRVGTHTAFDRMVWGVSGTGRERRQAGCHARHERRVCAIRHAGRGAAVGLERTLCCGFALEATASYIFDRRLFQGTSFLSGRTDVVTFDPGLGLALQLLWRRRAVVSP